MIIYLRQAPENRYDIVCEFVYQLLRIFGGGFGRCEVLGQRGRDLTDVTFINENNSLLVVATFGTNVFNGARIFLLNISAQISKPPSIHRFLTCGI